MTRGNMFVKLGQTPMMADPTHCPTRHAHGRSTERKNHSKMSESLFYPDHILHLKPYVPGLPIEDLARRLGVEPGSIVKLASNENPQGASTRALAALEAARIDLSRYPDNDCTNLVGAISRRHEVPRDWVVCGAGSEAVIGNAVSTMLTTGRKTLYSQYSFQAYVGACQRVGATPIVVPSPAFTVDLRAMRAQLSNGVSLIYIANPGNPTGTAVDPDELAAFIASVPQSVVVILDEAYFEYMPEAIRSDSIALVRKHPNLLVSRTFSKAYGLAGLRVGYGIAQAQLAEMLRRVRAPFSVSESAQIAAEAALDDGEFIARTIQLNRECQKMLHAALDRLGINYLPSTTNFVLAEVGDGAALARRLEQHSLIVRPVNSYGLPNWVRFSLGTVADTERLIHALTSTA